MTKQSTAIALALIVAIMPFLGFSSDINNIFYTVAGVIIAGLVHLSTMEYCYVCRAKIERGENEQVDKVAAEEEEEEAAAVSGNSKEEEIVETKEDDLEGEPEKQ